MHRSIHHLFWLVPCVPLVLLGCPATYDDDSADDDDATEATISNNPDGCSETLFVAPTPNEVGNWGAARLTPPGAPFEVAQITYTATADSGLLDCDPTIAHTVSLFTGADVAPAAEPTFLAQIDVPSGGSAGAARLLEVAVDPPVTVPEGEHLFVAVQWVGAGDPVQPLCLKTCLDEGWSADRNYWSITNEPPFDWRELASWNIEANYLVAASGHY